MSTQTLSVTRSIVSENHRMAITEKLFGLHFPLRLEPIIYTFTELLTKDYNGGFWEFYRLSNGGFYMAPNSDACFDVRCDNQFRGELSADALGITACLYAYSHLSFGDGDFGRECARHYHLLREYMMDHPEVRGILGATD